MLSVLPRRGRFRRALILIITGLMALDVAQIVSWRQHWQAPLPSRSKQERIFIASIHWNNEAVLRSAWNDAVIALVHHLGHDNVFVSVLESGSWDNTKGALRELDATLQQMNVPRRILLEQMTHAEEIGQPEKQRRQGWIETTRGKELRRVPYLAKLRNRSLEPLIANGTSFDRVLFLNDVVFTDAQTLLATRNGQYAAACSLDFAKPPAYYDTFALRDDQGREAVTSTFPYFRSARSRSAMLRGQPVAVQSCWNGIVAFDAKPFVESALQFRGIPDSLASYHLEGSECCLVHADNPSTKGVWLNPQVRVAYSSEAYRQVNGGGWPSLSETVTGIWKNRIWRWSTTDYFKGRRVKSRVRRWQRRENEQERGLTCLINEMQVLVDNGWAHV